MKRTRIERACRELQGHVVWVEAHTCEIVSNVNDWRDDARHGRNYDTDGRGGGELTQPEAHADAILRGRRDEIGALISEFEDALAQARLAAFRLRKLAGNFVTSTIDTRQASSVANDSRRSAGAGHCLNCETYCAGIANDRLRGGRCDPCRQWLNRHGEERPRDRWEYGDSVPVGTTDTPTPAR